ncbi:MGDG synthase family glycosyltransferase [Brevibacillus choshinensis]|uniref:MGDG synthase family glycosyltransferase n=1 Tax=Brevibacillus choshinensis TaxID=54911 RepID=UPI002E1EB90E|nr:glycosyltransferase [Brevibacillus choshinensis]MED4755602.1 glycosyltransferase [Brevibacillus choshinensis]
MGKRFLLVTEEWAGSGHRMAAQALAEELRARPGSESTRVVGGLETASPALRELSRFFYLGMLRYAPPLWQRLYEQEKIWSTTLRKPLGWWLSLKLTHELLIEEQPDVVIATHAYCLSALALAKQKMDKPFHLVSVPTDYHINHFWIHPQIDSYIVAHEQLAAVLTNEYQVSADKVHVHGIPVRPAFHEAGERDKPGWRTKLGLSLDRFTVLVSGGEGGYGGIQEMLYELIKIQTPLQIIVITGKNAKLQMQLEAWLRLETSQHHVVFIKGYEPQMWQWIGAADVYISKPGGISCAEALALKTPLILYRPLPGQERRNSAFFMQNEAAVIVERPEEIHEVINRLRNREQWERVIEKMESLRRPEAAYKTAEYLLGL